MPLCLLASFYSEHCGEACFRWKPSSCLTLKNIVQCSWIIPQGLSVLFFTDFILAKWVYLLKQFNFALLRVRWKKDRKIPNAWNSRRWGGNGLWEGKTRINIQLPPLVTLFVLSVPCTYNSELDGPINMLSEDVKLLFHTYSFSLLHKHHFKFHSTSSFITLSPWSLGPSVCCTRC